MILNLPKLCNNHKGLASWVRVQSHFAFWEHCRDVRYFLISQCGICLLGFPSIIISNHLLDVWQFTLQMLAVIPLIFIICRLKRGKKTGKFNKIKSYVLAAGKAEVNKKKKKKGIEVIALLGMLNEYTQSTGQYLKPEKQLILFVQSYLQTWVLQKIHQFLIICKVTKETY